MVPDDLMYPDVDDIPYGASMMLPYGAPSGIENQYDPDAGQYFDVQADPAWREAQAEWLLRNFGDPGPEVDDQEADNG